MITNVHYYSLTMLYAFLFLCQCDCVYSVCPYVYLTLFILHIQQSTYLFLQRKINELILCTLMCQILIKRQRNKLKLFSYFILKNIFHTYNGTNLNWTVSCTCRLILFVLNGTAALISGTTEFHWDITVYQDDLRLDT